MPFELAATSVCEHANFGDAVWQPLRDPLSNGLGPWAPLIARHFQAGSAVTGECLAAFRGFATYTCHLTLIVMPGLNLPRVFILKRC